MPVGNAKDGEFFPRTPPAIVQVLSQLRLESTHYLVVKRSALTLVILKETSLNEQNEIVVQLGSNRFPLNGIHKYDTMGCFHSQVHFYEHLYAL